MKAPLDSLGRIAAACLPGLSSGLRSILPHRAAGAGRDAFRRESLRWRGSGGMEALLTWRPRSLTSPRLPLQRRALDAVLSQKDALLPALLVHRSGAARRRRT